MEIRKGEEVVVGKLFKLQDSQYKEFHQKLIPTIDSELIIGIRTPILRKFAKEFSKKEESSVFLKELPHRYYEENNLHAFLIEQIKDFDAALYETERFLPYINNWATCDSFKPKAFKSESEKLLPKIYEWLKSNEVYTVRYAIGLLMSFFLDEKFKPEYAERVAEVKSDEYYVNMMIAWYFATALAKQYDAIIPYFTERKLDLWVHNKTIQKAIESNRISPNLKTELRNMRIK